MPHVGVGRKEEMRMYNCKNGIFNQGISVHCGLTEWIVLMWPKT